MAKYISSEQFVIPGLLSILNIAEWSCNFRSCINAALPGFVIHELSDEEIFILTEILDNDSVNALKTQLNNFAFYTSQRVNNKGNQVIIAVRKEYPSRVVSNILRGDEVPNFLHVEVIINGIAYNIIGTRIRYYQNYNTRLLQFNALSNYIKDLDNVILMGDFNNSKIRGNIGATNTAKQISSIYGSRAQFPYNYHVMKNVLAPGFIIHTPSNGGSWGLCNNGTICDGIVENDHLITKGNGIKVTSCVYDWDFVHKNQVQYLNMPTVNYTYFKKEYPTIKASVGYPDHAILRAKILLES